MVQPVEKVKEVVPDDVKPPTHMADWNFFLKHLDDRELQIGSCFDLENWKNKGFYRFRISHIYDPSHFWVVHKEHELDTLHKYIFEFYIKYKVHYKIPYKSFKINMYCITYTDKAFYRSVLVNLPFGIEDEKLAFVFLIDFGYMAKVSIDELYFMTTKMYSVPRFAVRASLAEMGPVNSTTWSTSVVSQFMKIASDKILFGQVVNKNYAEKILCLKLSEYNWTTQNLKSINDLMVNEQLAKQMSILDIREMKHSEKKKRPKRVKKIKLPFLSPTFDELEKCAGFDTVLGDKYLKEYAC